MAFIALLGPWYRFAVCISQWAVVSAPFTVVAITLVIRLRSFIHRLLLVPPTIVLQLYFDIHVGADVRLGDQIMGYDAIWTDLFAKTKDPGAQPPWVMFV